jgi:integrase
MTQNVKHKRYIRIGGKLIGKQFTRKSDADAWYAARRREKELLDSGLATPVHEQSLKEYAEHWMKARIAQGKPQSSWKTDERRLKLHVFSEMGDRLLSRISRKEWEAYLNSLVTQKGLSSGSRNRVRALMSKMYNDAIREEVVTTNPLRDVSKYSETQRAWDYWHTKDECSRYLQAAKEEGPMFFIFAMLALNTGCRIGEILAFTDQDIDLEKRTIHVWKTYEQESRSICERTKGKNSRWLGINEDLLKALFEHRQTLKLKSSDFLVQRENGKHFEEWMIRHRHYRTCRRAGLKKIRVHDLRHTYASHYVMSGGSLSDLQALLGHSHSEMTRKYAHLAPGHLESKSSVVSFAGVTTSAPADNRNVAREMTDNPVTIGAENEARVLPQNVIPLRRFV